MMQLFLGLGLPGAGEWAIIAVIVLLLFGGKNVPEMAKKIGKGIREFKQAMNGITNLDPPKKPPTPEDDTPSKES